METHTYTHTLEFGGRAPFRNMICGAQQLQKCSPRALCPEVFKMEMFSIGVLHGTPWLSYNGLFSFLLCLSGAKVREEGSDASGYLSKKEDRGSTAVIFDNGALLVGRN